MKLILLFISAAGLLVLSQSLNYEKKEYHYVLLDKQLDETSGLLNADIGIWTHNDSDSEPILYKISDITGKIEKQVTITNAENIDWEGIAADENYVYVADCGNNKGYRRNLRILKVSKQDLVDNKRVTAEIINFSYPEQTDFTPRKVHDFDCEAVIIKNNQLYLFTKNRDQKGSHLYTLPTKAGTYSAKKIGTYNIEGLITGACLNPKDNSVYLLGYGFYYHIPNFNGTVNKGYQKGLPELVNMQTEGIDFKDDNTLYISCENYNGISQRLITVPIK